MNKKWKNIEKYKLKETINFWKIRHFLFIFVSSLSEFVVFFLNLTWAVFWQARKESKGFQLCRKDWFVICI